MGPELTDILSSLTCIVVMVAVLKLWTPANIMRLEGDKPISTAVSKHSGGEIFMAWVPYLLLVVFVLVWGEARSSRASIGWVTACCPPPCRPSLAPAHSPSA